MRLEKRRGWYAYDERREPSNRSGRHTSRWSPPSGTGCRTKTTMCGRRRRSRFPAFAWLQGHGLAVARSGKYSAGSAKPRPAFTLLPWTKLRLIITQLVELARTRLPSSSATTTVRSGGIMGHFPAFAWLQGHGLAVARSGKYSAGSAKPRPAFTPSSATTTVRSGGIMGLASLA
jgi:hypothetical protein